MAVSRILIPVFLTASILSTMAVAKEFVVGDDRGWATGFNYQAWAANKIFRVGDTLVFNYPRGKDNVTRVGGNDFIHCSIPPLAPVLISGHDMIVLGSTGRRWYISGFYNHCNLGQKLVITVLPPEGAWSPTSSPSSAPERAISSPTSSSPSSPERAISSPTSSPSPLQERALSLTPSPSPSPVRAKLSPTSSSSPVPLKVPSPQAPWTASAPHYGRWVPKKLFKIFE
ncbi:blue copper protein 1a-like [Gastrolobium bilobum]|uniref:blue copper protein 1a-like n=1 Tax=Gastrolobium bilobum TaxID=150636 RepID=UPI002AB1BEDC|nr:blue copper protein 1a-like [Gastrolobium bilobum]